MIFDKRLFYVTLNQTIILDDEYSIEESDILGNCVGLKSVQQVHLSGKMIYDQYYDLVNVDLVGRGVAIVECALTMKELVCEFSFDVEDEVAFFNNKLDLKPLVLMSIINSIDGVLFDSEANRSFCGDGWSFGESNESNVTCDERLSGLRAYLEKME